MPYADRQKQLEFQRRWNRVYYQQNKISEQKRIVQRKQQIGKWIHDYKSQFFCKSCGEKDPVCLDFHHTNPESKDFSLSYARAWGWGKVRIEAELKKCVVLCSNCHRKEHAVRKS